MQQSKHFFELLQGGTSEIGKITQTAYIIMGVTRIGKTCLFNHIRCKRMIGRLDTHHRTRVVYHPHPEQGETYQDYALMSAQIDSLTIAPNISDLGHSVSLVDLAGFQQNRDENEIMAVSYFLLSCFRKLKKVKFILTFNEDQLTSTRNPWIDTLDCFLNLFRIGQLTTAAKQNFMNSISLVVTKAEEKQEYFRDCLDSILKQLSQERSLKNKPNKLHFIEVFKHIAQKNRVHIFGQAQNQVTIKNSEIVNDLNKLGWQFFDLEAAQKELSKSKAELLVVPFYQEYKALKESQTIRLNKQIQRQVQSLLKLNTIFKVALNQVKKYLSGQKCNYNAIFVSISQLLNQFYPYHPINMQLHTDNNKAAKVEIIDIITQTVKIFDLNCQLHQTLTLRAISFQHHIDKCMQIYLNMVQCLQPICTIQQHYNLLEKLKYRFKRQFQQFSTIYELTPNIISDIGRKMLDVNTLQINQTSKLKLYELFSKKLDLHSLQTEFRDVEMLNKTIKIVQQYRKCFQKEKALKDAIHQPLESKEDFDYKLSILYADISSTKIGILNALKSDNTVQEHCHLIDLLLNQPAIIKKLNKTAQEQQQILLQNHHRTIGVIGDLACLLLELHSPTNASFRTFALELSELARNVPYCDLIYGLMINQQNQSNQRLLLVLDDYVGWCKKWGFLEQAKKSLFHKIYIYQKSKQFDQLQRVQAELINLHDEAPILMQQYRKLIEVMLLPFDLKEIHALGCQTGKINQFLKNKQANTS